MTTKRNTVTIAFEDEDYKALADLAKAEDRTNAGQARHMLRRELEHRQMVEAALRNPQTLPGEHQPETHDVTGSAEEPLPG